MFIQGQGAFPGGKKLQEKVITEKKDCFFTFIFHNVLTSNMCLPLRSKRKRKKIYTRIIIRCSCTIMDVSCRLRLMIFQFSACIAVFYSVVKCKSFKLLPKILTESWDRSVISSQIRWISPGVTPKSPGNFIEIDSFLNKLQKSKA